MSASFDTGEMPLFVIDITVAPFSFATCIASATSRELPECDIAISTSSFVMETTAIICMWSSV